MTESKTVRVLVVDDERAVRDVLTALLNAAGHESAAAANGREALEMLERKQFDVILLDLVMPEQEGLETIQRLRKRADCPYIVAMSGAFGGEYLRIARSLGADHMLQKPISREALLAAVEERPGGAVTR